MVVAVDFYFGGGSVDAPATSLAVFLLIMSACVVVPLYFNRSVNHDSWYVDEHWGDGSIDDDNWGLDITDARLATRRRLAALAERSSSGAAP